MARGFTQEWLKDALAKNPGLSIGDSVSAVPFPKPQPIQEKPQNGKGVLRGKRKMNKTEAAYGKLLEAKKQRGEIIDYKWEGLTLRWDDGMTYTPDWTVYESVLPAEDRPFVSILLIETKGGHIYDDSKVKFRAARENWPMFRFEMWQTKKGQWMQIA
jgi:hypothetical protein